MDIVEHEYGGTESEEEFDNGLESAVPVEPGIAGRHKTVDFD